MNNKQKTAVNLEGLTDKDAKSEEKQQEVLPQGDAAEVEVKGVDMVQNLMEWGFTKELAEKMSEKDKENAAKIKEEAAEAAAKATAKAADKEAAAKAADAAKVAADKEAAAKASDAAKVAEEVAAADGTKVTKETWVNKFTCSSDPEDKKKTAFEWHQMLRDPNAEDVDKTTFIECLIRYTNDQNNDGGDYEDMGEAEAKQMWTDLVKYQVTKTGGHYVGDPCYVIRDGDWLEFCKRVQDPANAQRATHENMLAVTNWNGEQLELWSNGGDGHWTWGDKGFSVDSGMFGVLSLNCLRQDEQMKVFEVSGGSRNLATYFNSDEAKPTLSVKDGTIYLSGVPDDSFGEDDGEVSTMSDKTTSTATVEAVQELQVLLNIPDHVTGDAYAWLPDKKTCIKFQAYPAMCPNKVRNFVKDYYKDKPESKFYRIKTEGVEVYADADYVGDGPVLLDPWTPFKEYGLESNFVLQVVQNGGDPSRLLPSLDGDEASPDSEISSQPSDDDEEEGQEEEKAEKIALKLLYDKVVQGAARGTRSGVNADMMITTVEVKEDAECGLFLTMVSRLSGVAARDLALFYKGQRVLSLNMTFEQLEAVDGDRFQVALATGF